MCIKTDEKQQYTCITSQQYTNTTNHTYPPPSSPHTTQVIAHAPTFYAAVQKMQRALYEFTIRGVKTNILFIENVLRHPEFLSGTATTSFIERNPSLFTLSSGSALQSSKLLTYLAEMVVNGPQHPGATGPPPVRVSPVPPHHAVGPPPPGWREVLLKEGPEGWAKAVRNHQGVLLTDTTWWVGWCMRVGGWCMKRGGVQDMSSSM